jgi:hypothetical protein
LPYEGEVRSFLGLEVALVFVLLVIELSRLFVGERGNKLEQVHLTSRISHASAAPACSPPARSSQATPLLVFVLLTLVAALGNFYFLYLQIFVTRADLILNAVSLAFQGLGVLLAIPTLITFRRAPKAVGQ